jgi:hypothetical protein
MKGKNQETRNKNQEKEVIGLLSCRVIGFKRNVECYMLPRINLLYTLRVGNRDDQKNKENFSDQMLN